MENQRVLVLLEPSYNLRVNLSHEGLYSLFGISILQEFPNLRWSSKKIPLLINNLLFPPSKETLMMLFPSD